ncbi:MAG: hypothetical protein M1825_001257, partial [Sarcosagium campestre]
PYDRRAPRRNRSRSPPNIDRYQPSDSYYGPTGRDRDERRRLSPPPSSNIDRYVPGQETKPILVNPVPDPHKLEYQVGFSYFGEWWRHNEAIKEERERLRVGGRRPPDRVKGERETREERAKEKTKIQIAYDSYKEDMQVRMAKSFVQVHKNEEWFKERYVSEIRDEFKPRLNDYRREYYSHWERDMDAGTFDEFTLEGIYKSESNGAGGLVEKEEGETTAAAEVLGVGDLLPSKGGVLRDEAAFQPALLIKTIAPTVSRAKIEEFCREHLGEGEGGFKWLSLSDPNPSKRYHRIGWVTLHPSSPVETMDRSDGRDEEEVDGELGSGSAQDAAASASEKALEAINSKTIHDETRGDFTIHAGVHAPPSEPRKKALWDLFSAPERVERDLELITQLVAKLDADSAVGFDGAARIEARAEDLRQRGLLQPPVKESNGKKRRLSQDVLDMDAESPEEGAADEDMQDDEDEGAYDEETDDEDLIFTKKKLDLYVEYLRRVYNFCFFCVFESDSVHELARKCPGGHLRRPRASLNSAAKAAAKASAVGEPFPAKKKDAKEEGEETLGSEREQKFQRSGSKNEQQLQRAFNWVKTFEEKILQILRPEEVDLRKLGGKPVEEALDEEMAKHVKQEDENKFRCKVPECTKLFKGEPFWRKHVEKRHPEWLEKVKQDLNLVNNYVLDPSHIAPSRSDANSNGHFPNNNQFASGTPRGFSIGNMPVNFAPPFGAGAGGPGVFSGAAPGFGHVFGQGSVQMPQGSWGAGGPGFNSMEDRHQPGPMRRGGFRNNNNNNRTGPYDRRQNPRFGGSGRLTPPRGGGAAGQGISARGGGAGKWGDGSGGAAVGPRESVQGRSLKSYEDLDAVGGGGGGELNY